MTNKEISFFRKWFSDYCKSFYSHNEEDNKNISVKEHHTLNVCQNAVLIAKNLSLDENSLLLAEASALFHDLGRFRQYALYKTFIDRDSVNHGVLGAEILAKEKVLEHLPENEQRLIIETVRFHNAFKLPRLNNKEIIKNLKIIRDADKLDIWQVLAKYYISTAEDRPSAVSLGMPDTPEYSRDIILSILNKQMAFLKDVKTLNDFKLLQLSWVYDINFPASLNLLIERGHIMEIADTLPQTEDIRNAVRYIQRYLTGK
ncbi:MAG: HD domain-containing protein [Deltaproteobacteria bacterium]|nr:HD domain-containing protein [Deltaproteobacteria bacterium]